VHGHLDHPLLLDDFAGSPAPSRTGRGSQHIVILEAEAGSLEVSIDCVVDAHPSRCAPIVGDLEPPRVERPPVVSDEDEVVPEPPVYDRLRLEPTGCDSLEILEPLPVLATFVDGGKVGGAGAPPWTRGHL